MATPIRTSYTVDAYNVSHASENKIHDDAVAKKLGFSGGLVPGVEVYAYASHLAVQRWGRVWLERGTMEARFLKPVYDGRKATVTAEEQGEVLQLKVESEGVLCATGRAGLGSASQVAPWIEGYQHHPSPDHSSRPPADEKSLAPGNWLGIAPITLTKEVASTYLKDVREQHPIYAKEGLAHPGTLLRLCNAALRENVVLAPWIHTGSRVRNFGVGRIGDEFTVRARVQDNYERKGHRLVDLDCLIIKNGTTPIAHILHTAVYRLRHLEAA